MVVMRGSPSPILAASPAPEFALAHHGVLSSPG